MKPTLLIGDYLVVNRAAYGFPRLMCSLGLCDGDLGPFGTLPERGDVVVFRHPVSKHDYIKRLVGLPEDRVQLRDGVLVLNGARQEQVALAGFEEVYRQRMHGSLPACSNGVVALGAACLKHRAREVLDGGRTYDVLNIRDGLAADNTAEFVVPEGHMFVLGDNRDNSIDSRFSQAGGGVGLVPFENVIGRADLVVFNMAGIKGRSLTWLQ